MVELLRPYFDEVVAKADPDGDVVLTDHMNKFIDDLVLVANQLNYEGWRNIGDDGQPEFKNSFASFGSSAPVRFKRIAGGVAFSGHATEGTGVVFTLPEGQEYRPDKSRSFSATTNSANSMRIVVNTNGDVSIVGAPTLFTSFEFVMIL